jgi:hypothetical protein
MMMIGKEMIVAEQGDIVITNPFEVHSSILSDGYMGKYFILMVDLDFFADNGIFDFDLRRELLVNGQRFNHRIYLIYADFSTYTFLILSKNW